LARNVPRDWVYQRFREIGLETYIQNYTVNYPLQIARGQVMEGTINARTFRSSYCPHN